MHTNMKTISIKKTMPVIPIKYEMQNMKEDNDLRNVYHTYISILTYDIITVQSISNTVLFLTVS